ncbi:MAG: hypothetical protein GJV46_10070 [Geobacter sp.]|nr:hypothetical protein [Geobacter sp.]
MDFSGLSDMYFSTAGQTCRILEPTAGACSIILKDAMSFSSYTCHADQDLSGNLIEDRQGQTWIAFDFCRGLNQPYFIGSVYKARLTTLSRFDTTTRDNIGRQGNKPTLIYPSLPLHIKQTVGTTETTPDRQSSILRYKSITLSGYDIRPADLITSNGGLLKVLDVSKLFNGISELFLQSM